MPNLDLQTIKDRISQRHQGDQSQLNVVFSESNRLIVEAPAGYGKTNTMISRIAYLLCSNQIAKPKKLLAMTFSVNAAHKIKKDVALEIPKLLEGSNASIKVNERVVVSNYHGFCRRVLSKYGHFLHPALKSMEALSSIDDSNARNIQTTVNTLTVQEALLLSNFASAVKNADEIYLNNYFNDYCSIVISKVLVANYIPYNSIICLTLSLFLKFPEILKFYQQYYSTILIDEYQDTNALAYWLVKQLVTPSSGAIFLGDSLQRIYGFIGAVDNLMNISEAYFGLRKISLQKNYRFASNPDMLLLDGNIRRNAELPANPSITSTCRIPFTLWPNQNTEALEVVRKSVQLVHDSSGGKVAILVKQRGENINAIIDTLEHNDIPYFYGLFTDDDPEYLRFHSTAIAELETLRGVVGRINRSVANAHISSMNGRYPGSRAPIIQSLFKLLEIFWNKTVEEIKLIPNEEKFEYAFDTFMHSGLKQYLQFTTEHILISTVHAAKGLEWDFVMLPDMEQEAFPAWIGSLCNKGACQFRSNCILTVNAHNEKSFLEELSVFYVAVTRARKQVYFFASSKDARGYNKNTSCFVKLPGISI